MQAIELRRIRSCLRRQSRHGSRSQHVYDGRLSLSPNLVGRTPFSSFAGRALGDALVQPHRAFDRLHYIQQRDACGRNRQRVTSARATLRPNQPGTHQLLQYLRQKMSRNVGRFRQRGLPHPRICRQPGQMNHHPDGIIRSASDLHAIPKLDPTLIPKLDLLSPIRPQNLNLGNDRVCDFWYRTL